LVAAFAYLRGKLFWRLGRATAPGPLFTSKPFDSHKLSYGIFCSRQEQIELMDNSIQPEILAFPSPPKGSIGEGSEICVSAEATPDELAIAVVDHGVGLPAVAAAVLTGRSGTSPPLDGGGLGL
jgi:hypothetical protein